MCEEATACVLCGSSPTVHTDDVCESCYEDVKATRVTVAIEAWKPQKEVWPARWSDPTYLGDGPWGA